MECKYKNIILVEKSRKQVCMTNNRCVFTFTHPTTPICPSFKPFYECVKNGRTDGQTDRRTDILTSKLLLIIIYLHFQTQMREKTRHFHDFTNALETDLRSDGGTYGPTILRTDKPTYRDARTHLKNLFFSCHHETLR